MARANNQNSDGDEETRFDFGERRCRSSVLDTIICSDNAQLCDVNRQKVN